MSQPSNSRTAFEIVGLLAVVMSLAFVGYELRQNTKQMRVQASDSITERVNQMNSGVYTNPTLAEIVYRGELNRDSLSAVEKTQFDMFQFARLNLAEYILDLEEQGVGNLSFDFNEFVIRKFRNSPGLQEFVQEYDSTYLGTHEFYSQLFKKD